jgi:tRNA pseudouridine65 synthase
MLDVLYRDDAFIAIHKPAGLLVHRSALDRHETRFAVQLLRDQIGAPVFPVHRLDRGTSGVLLFALNKPALRAASESFQNDQVTKRYVAIVRGWPADMGTINHPLKRIADDYEFRASDATVSAQSALTHYRVLARTELPIAISPYASSRYALVALTPVTGRRHQLRRHLKHIAHPIIGDATYGKGAHNRAFAAYIGYPRLLLACTYLALEHPITRSLLEISAPPQADFSAVCAALNWGHVFTNKNAFVMCAESSN